jgi:hypothetical protein
LKLQKLYGVLAVVAIVIMMVVVFALPLHAAEYSVGIHGGQTNPHSECDGGSCLDLGYAVGVSVDRTWEWTDSFSLRYGLNAWYMDFSASDRETSSSPRTNTRAQRDLLATGTLKPTLTLFERYSIFPILGAGIDTSGETYTVLGGGVDVRVYKRLHVEAQSQAMKAKCTWHRVTTLGLRLDF